MGLSERQLVARCSGIGVTLDSYNTANHTIPELRYGRIPGDVEIYIDAADDPRRRHDSNGKPPKFAARSQE